MKVRVTKGSRDFENDDSRGFKGQPPNARPEVICLRSMEEESPPENCKAFIPKEQLYCSQNALETSVLVSGVYRRFWRRSTYPPIERGQPKRHEAVHLALDGVKWRVNEYHGSFTRTS